MDNSMKIFKNMEPAYRYSQMEIYMWENMIKESLKAMANIIGIVVHFIGANFCQE